MLLDFLELFLISFILFLLEKHPERKVEDFSLQLSHFIDLLGEKFSFEKLLAVFLSEH